MHCIIGSQYAWGNIVPYIVGYYRDLGFDANLSKFYFVLPLIVATSTFVFPLGMALTAQAGSRLTILLGGIIACTAVAFASVASSPLSFYVLYGIGFGVGKGFLYPSPLVAGWSHLPGRKGFVSGIIVSGLGFGALVFGILAQRIVNPNNIEP